MNVHLEQKVRQLPHRPGVYKFLDAKGRVIYIGKANSLAIRVGQYFQKNLRDGKTKQLIDNVADLETIEVFSELEALILEAELIKKFRPKYNISLKDDKSYLYIVIRQEGEFKKVLTARKNGILSRDKIFGPFPDGQTAKYILRAMRRIFPFRDCSLAKFAKYQKLGSPCLFGHIKLCPGPCVNKGIKAEYNLNIKRLIRFLRGEQKTIAEELRKKMGQYAKNQQYEQAQEAREILKRIDYVQQSFRSPSEFMENPYLADDIYEMALDQLAKALPILKNAPKRIECYDVANISGKDAAVSMVVAVDGRLEKREYKKFKIKLKDTPDDLFMLREALTRRFLREVRDDLVSWGLPDLVMVDGGKGQVSVAEDVLNRLGLDVPVIGLAKKEELVVYRSERTYDGIDDPNLDQPKRAIENISRQKGYSFARYKNDKNVLFSNSREDVDADGEFKELRLEKSSEALKLLQRLRDESHRFARVYHHYLRTKHIGG